MFTVVTLPAHDQLTSWLWTSDAVADHGRDGWQRKTAPHTGQEVKEREETAIPHSH